MVDLRERAIPKEVFNADLCKKCGGRCCKSYPCIYYPSDFKVITEDVVEELVSDNIAVIDIIDENSISGLAKFSYFVLRARGRFDLKGSFAGVKVRFNNHNRCIHLKSDGCSLSINNRPGEGIYLTPREKQCFIPKQYSSEERKWYQDLRNQIVLYNIIEEHREISRLASIQDQLILEKRYK